MMAVILATLGAALLGRAVVRLVARRTSSRRAGGEVLAGLAVLLTGLAGAAGPDGIRPELGLVTTVVLIAAILLLARNAVTDRSHERERAGGPGDRAP